MPANIAYFTNLNGKKIEIEMLQIVDDEFAELVTKHPHVTGIPYYFNSCGDVWPKPSKGIQTQITEICT